MAGAASPQTADRGTLSRRSGRVRESCQQEDPSLFRDFHHPPDNKTRTFQFEIYPLA